VPTHERLGPDNRENLQDRRKPAIQLDKKPAIMVRQPDATMQPAPQDNQAVSSEAGAVRVKKTRQKTCTPWSASEHIGFTCDRSWPAPADLTPMLGYLSAVDWK
jgi:hypothetical protein